MDRETFHSCSSLVKLPRQIHQQHCSSHFIEYIEREIPYSKFFKNYLIPNQPCMFSKKFTEEWNCRKKWVTAEGKPNLQRLLHEFGEQTVPVLPLIYVLFCIYILHSCCKCKVSHRTLRMGCLIMISQTRRVNDCLLQYCTIFLRVIYPAFLLR